MSAKTILFQPWKAALVEIGDSTQTIRRTRKRPIKVGDSLSLRKWTGAPYRSKQVKIGHGVCTWTLPIVMLPVLPINTYTDRQLTVLLDGNLLNAKEVQELAKQDGFSCTQDMFDWFYGQHHIPFEGHVIRWRLV